MKNIQKFRVFIFILLASLLTMVNGCKKDDNDTGTVTDIDGNGYNTVTIGTQVWLKENLKTTRYNNGDPIPEVADGTEWINLTSGAYCHYDNDVSYTATYGLLYNWYTVTDLRKICPAGWHVPSNDEWTTLINFAGGEDVAGGKLKEKGTIHWSGSNTEATDEYGFTALPAGYRLGANFDPPGYYAVWWSSTEKDLSDAWIIDLISSTTKSYIEAAYKRSGNSVRCIKD